MAQHRCESGLTFCSFLLSQPHNMERMAIDDGPPRRNWFMQCLTNANCCQSNNSPKRSSSSPSQYSLSPEDVAAMQCGWASSSSDDEPERRSPAEQLPLANIFWSPLRPQTPPPPPPTTPSSPSAPSSPSTPSGVSTPRTPPATPIQYHGEPMALGSPGGENY